MDKSKGVTSLFLKTHT
jgi:Leucine-rich repeat (LRR) protein